MLVDLLAAQGIRLPRMSDGAENRATCPQCKGGTGKEKSLSVKIDPRGDAATWICYRGTCGWTGAVGEKRSPERRQKPPAKRPVYAPPPPTDRMYEFFAKRGISRATVDRHGISVVRVWMPQKDAEVSAIAFPYRKGGEVVNVKYRDHEKNFRQEKDAEKVFWGLDDIEGDEAIIVEGEMDKLALEEAGFCSVLSVPDGAPKGVKEAEPDPENDAKFEYVWNCEEALRPLKRILLAVDSDGPGRALEEELARRLGRERCWRVRWPTQADVTLKDANETLLNGGTEVIRECIRHARPFPIAGLHDADDYIEELTDLYDGKRGQGLSTGWPSIDALMRTVEGAFTVITGVPNSGKSEWLDALMVNTAEMHGWRYAVCSFENPPEAHIAKLIEKRMRLPFWSGPTRRMDPHELRAGHEWVRDHFYFIRDEEAVPTVDWILEKARAAVMRHGINGLVIDPYNEIEHQRPNGMSETDYISQLIARLKRFARNHGVHVYIVAHPRIMRKEADGSMPVPTLYDISGSANWNNKADTGVVVHRDPNLTPPQTEVYIRKVRWKWLGQIGMATLLYDKATGRYHEGESGAMSPPRNYYDKEDA